MNRTIGLVLLLAVGCVSQPVQPPAPPAPPKPQALVRPLAVQAPPAPAPSGPTVTLAWDPEPAASGFNLYRGVAPRDYTNQNDVGSVTSVTIPIPAGVTNYFALTAYNTVVGMESDFSSEVLLSTAPAPTYVYLQAFIQTNSTLNTNTWGTYEVLPVSVITNPSPLQFYRVDLLIDHK